MSDISNLLIKDSYDYVIQVDPITNYVYRIGGAIPTNPIFLSGLTVNSSFKFSDGSEQNNYVLTSDSQGNATWKPISGTTTGTNGTSGSSGTSGSNGINGISSGQIYYFNQSVTQTPLTYKQLSTSPLGTPQTGVTLTLIGGSYNNLISEFITDASGLGFAVIPGGTQRFHLHFLKPASNDKIETYVQIDLATSGGTSYGTLTGNTNTALIGWVDASTPVEVTVDLVLPTITINPTDRMIVRIYTNNTDSSSHVIKWYTEGTSYYSFVVTSVGVIGGTSGTSGTAGANGTSGTAGANGTSGTSGTRGSSGTSGTNGANGSSGTAGSSGTSGSSGSSGTSGANGSSGSSGSSGTRGTSGSSGSSGSSGTSGTSGSSGTSGKSCLSVTIRNLTASLAGFDYIDCTFNSITISFSAGEQKTFCYNTIPELDPARWSTINNGACQGSSGTSGTSGLSGATGTSGTSGSSGIGSSGTSGTSGANGTSPLAFIYYNVAFVHPNGNDATAVLGDFGKPFATIEGAFYGANGLNFTDPYGGPLTTPVTNGVIEVWPDNSGSYKSYSSSDLLPSTTYSYTVTKGLVATTSFKLHLKPGVHIQYVPDSTVYLWSPIPFITLESSDPTIPTIVTITSDGDRTSSIEQKYVNVETIENYFARIPSNCELRIKDISIYSEPFSVGVSASQPTWSSFSLLYDGSQNGLIGGSLILDNCLVLTTNKYLYQVGPNYVFYSNVFQQSYTNVELRNTDMEIQDWVNFVTLTDNTEFYTHFRVYPVVDTTDSYVITRLHNSRFINYSYYDDRTEPKYYAYYIKTDISNTKFLVLDDCTFWRGKFFYENKIPYLDTIYESDPHFCIFVDIPDDLKIQYVSRSIHNYNQGTFELANGTITELSGYATSQTNIAVAGYGMLEQYAPLLIPFNSRPIN